MIDTRQIPCTICGDPSVVCLVDSHRIKPQIVEVAPGVGKAFVRQRPVEQHAFCQRHVRVPRVYGLNGKLLRLPPPPQVPRRR